MKFKAVKIVTTSKAWQSAAKSRLRFEVLWEAQHGNSEARLRDVRCLGFRV